MTYEASAQAFGKQAVQIVELWMPRCTRTYGVSPCTAEKGVTAVALSCKKPGDAAKVLKLAAGIAPHRDSPLKPLRMLVMGKGETARRWSVAGAGGSDPSPIRAHPQTGSGSGSSRMGDGSRETPSRASASVRAPASVHCWR